MTPVVFESTISVGERPQTYALDRTATGTGQYLVLCITIQNVQHQTSCLKCSCRRISGERHRVRALWGNIQTNRFVGALNDIYVNLYCDSVQSSRRITKFRQNTLPSSSRFSADGGSTFLRNYDAHLPIYTI